MSKVEAWVNRRQAAAICQITERHFDAQLRPKLSQTATRGQGKTLQFDAIALVAMLLDYRAAQAKRPEISGPDGLMTLLDGDDLTASSPALERFRLARAQLIELDLMERQRKVVSIDLLNEALTPAMTALRQTGERINKMYGGEACEIFNEGVDEFAAAARRVLSQVDAGDRSDSAPQPTQ